MHEPRSFPRSRRTPGRARRRWHPEPQLGGGCTDLLQEVAVGGTGDGQAQSPRAPAAGERPGSGGAIPPPPSKPASRGKEAELGEDAERLAIDMGRDRQPAAAVDELHHRGESRAGWPAPGRRSRRRPAGRRRPAAVARRRRRSSLRRRPAAWRGSVQPQLSAAARSGNRPTTCTSSALVNSIPRVPPGVRRPAKRPRAACAEAPRAEAARAASWTAPTLPAALWSQMAIMSSPLANAVATMAGGVISSEAHGDNAVWMCRSARNDLRPGAIAAGSSLKHGVLPPRASRGDSPDAQLVKAAHDLEGVGR